MRFRTLIVDDEELARKRLRRLLVSFPEEIEIAGEAENGEKALEFINENSVDLVFLDIQMPGIGGLELARILGDRVVVIFTTAFDEYALRAFEANSVDYLLKPIEKERLERAVRKAVKLSPSQKSEKWVSILEELRTMKKEPENTITVKEGEKVYFLKPEEILYFRAEDRYVKARTEEKSYWLSEPLAAIEKKLPSVFVRSHRSVLVNRKRIKEARRWFGGKYKLILDDKKKSELPLSKSYKKNFGL
jgi:two-component system LytT family response regulator